MRAPGDLTSSTGSSRSECSWSPLGHSTCSYSSSRGSISSAGGCRGLAGVSPPNQIARESLPRCPPLSQSAARGGSPRARRLPCAGRADPRRRSPRTGSPSAYAAPASWRSVSPAAAPLAPRWPRTRATPRRAGVEPGDLTTSAVVTASPADAGALESGATSASRWVLAAVRIGLTCFRQQCRATIFVASFAAPATSAASCPCRHHHLTSGSTG